MILLLCGVFFWITFSPTILNSEWNCIISENFVLSPGQAHKIVLKQLLTSFCLGILLTHLSTHVPEWKHSILVPLKWKVALCSVVQLLLRTSA